MCVNIYKSRQKLDNVPVVYDLGSSTEIFAKACVKSGKNNIRAYLCGLDNALAMIDKAQLKKSAMGFNIDFLHADFLTFKFISTDVFLSFYTMQFVRPLQRKDMIQKIYDALHDDGIFLFAEKVISHDT